MATVTDYNFKIYGIVTYTNGSWGPFEATLAKSRLATPYASDALANFKAAKRDKSSLIVALLALLPNLVTLSPATSTDSRTVSSLVMTLGGQIALSDGTTKAFVIEYLNGNVEPSSIDTDTVWGYLRGDATIKAAIKTVFEALVGTGNATLA